jgi:hypothetical protein
MTTRVRKQFLHLNPASQYNMHFFTSLYHFFNGIRFSKHSVGIPLHFPDMKFKLYLGGGVFELKSKTHKNQKHITNMMFKCSFSYSFF